ncbi:cytoplasmic copper homeostasis protein CutC [Bacillus sp. JCM 19047]|nr:cytoplasmic copper homeostasis protein CutC [Bacillus sp. JCM 19047]
MNNVVKEVCLENDTHVHQAIQYGAQRIELCDNLDVGGTTVSSETCKRVVATCKSNGVMVMALIRCRGGDFIYNEAELRKMEASISSFKHIGVDGFVFGCLTSEKKLHVPHMQRLLQLVDPQTVTFHMAFDQLENPFEAIDQLSHWGVKRILTHGPHKEITENLSTLAAYETYANERIVIMPGGGVTKDNAAHIAAATGVKELHGTRILW